MIVLSFQLYEDPRAASWRVGPPDARRTIVGVVLGVVIVEPDDDVRPQLRYIVSDVRSDSAEGGYELLPFADVSLYVGGHSA